MWRVGFESDDESSQPNQHEFLTESTQLNETINLM